MFLQEVEEGVLHRTVEGKPGFIGHLLPIIVELISTGIMSHVEEGVEAGEVEQQAQLLTIGVVGFRLNAYRLCFAQVLKGAGLYRIVQAWIDLTHDLVAGISQEAGGREGETLCTHVVVTRLEADVKVVAHLGSDLWVFYNVLSDAAKHLIL